MLSYNYKYIVVKVKLKKSGEIDSKNSLGKTFSAKKNFYL